MSVKNVMALAHKLEGNEALQNQIKALTPCDSEAVMKMAAGLGFDFMLQEFRDVIAREGELNDEQLDQVAGGIIAVQPAPTNAILIGLLLPAVTPNLNGGTLNFRKAG